MRVLAVIVGVILVAVNLGCTPSSVSPTDTVAVKDVVVREIKATPVPLPSAPSQNP